MSLPMERCHCYFNPRPPRGERRSACGGSGDVFAISIHALREESDFITSTHQPF